MKFIGRLLQANGYFWVSFISLIVAPLAYYRSLILGWSSTDGSLVGMYSVALIFTEIISTFVMIGGGTVITRYLPKLDTSQEKGSFLTRYAGINLGLLALLSIIALAIPSLDSLVNRMAEYHYGIFPLLVLGPFTILGYMAIYGLSGLGAFTLSSLLSNLQLVLVCLVSTVFYFFDREYFVSHGIPIFVATLVLAQTVNITVGLIKFYRLGIRFSLRDALPNDFYKFTSHIHINSICNFTYRTGDQIFILGALGLKELGAYYIAVQLADLINLLPLRTSQIMLAKFSQMVHKNSYDEVAATYALLTRVISSIAGSSALFLICFSEPIASIFGEWGSNKAQYLQCLAFIAVLGCMNSVNSMLIMASESTSAYLKINVLQMCVQLVSSFLLINSAQVFGIIAAKLLGMLVLQIGLFSIIKKNLHKMKISIPWHYFFSVVFVFVAVIFLQLRPLLDLASSITCFVILMAAYHFSLRVGPNDFRSLLLRV